MRWILLACFVAAVCPPPVGAQDQPEPGGGGMSTAIGLYGFSAIGGVDLEGDGQAIVAVALDGGHLLTPRLRLRPSGEIGFLGSDNRYLLNVEVVYRFIDDSNLAVPYLGTGLGLSGRAECGSDPDCPGVWLQFVLGFDMRIRGNVGWLLEYHPADALRRHRLMIGLTTRRGG
ncbi:MAG: hypothetical protein PVH40_08890 [Gemmatimonadales bacterium]